MKSSIIKKLIIIGIGIAICVGTFLISTMLINKKGITDGYVINIAGRERMLSQKISKEIFMLNSQEKVDFTELDKAIKEFREALDILRYGSKQHASEPPRNSKISEQLETINDLWGKFRESIITFRGAMIALKQSKSFLEENNREMLVFSDNIVKSMVKHNLSGQDIDDSGRQRMLTQRMAYHIMRYTNKWDTQSYSEFYNSLELYNETIVRFYTDNKYRKYPELFDVIQNAYNFWLEYSKHAFGILASQQTAVNSLNEIAIQNTQLLSEIESVVSMYEKESVATRTYLFKFQFVSAIILSILAIYAISVILKIRVMFNEFVQKSKKLAESKEGLTKEKIAEIITIEGENELSEISKNISSFLDNIDMMDHNSNRALELSENITEEITRMTNDVIKSLGNLKIGEEEKQKIISEVNLSEDIAIQTSEELISTSKLLKRLKKSLDVIAKYYDFTQNIKK